MNPDHSDIIKIEQRMKKAAKRLQELAPEVAMAITICDYDSERRKALLARYASKHLLAVGTSVAAAEISARADPSYDVEFNALMGQYQMAMATRKEFDVEQVAWETGRSLLARARETLRTLPDTEA